MYLSAEYDVRTVIVKIDTLNTRKLFIQSVTSILATLMTAALKVLLASSGNLHARYNRTMKMNNAVCARVILEDDPL
jgi:hypothetical protein